MSFASLPGAYITWDQTSESLDAWLRYNVWRRDDEGVVERIAVISDPTLTTYTDNTIPSDTPWEYAVTQSIQVGPEEVESEPEWFTAQGTIRSTFLHDWRNPAFYVELLGQAQRRAVEPSISYVLPWGQTEYTAHAGPLIATPVELEVTDAWYDNPDTWRAVRELIERQRDLGSVMVLRGHRDVRMFCAIDGNNAGDQPVLYTQSLRFTNLNVEEGV